MLSKPSAAIHSINCLTVRQSPASRSPQKTGSFRVFKPNPYPFKWGRAAVGPEPDPTPRVRRPCPTPDFLPHSLTTIQSRIKILSSRVISLENKVAWLEAENARLKRQGKLDRKTLEAIQDLLKGSEDQPPKWVLDYE